MTIWTIHIKTQSQDNTYCVDDESKVNPYVKKCMKQVGEDYETRWLMVDFAVIYHVGTRQAKWGEINRYTVH